MPNGRTILITGATGKQGGATIRALAGHGFKLRAMTRRPDCDIAVALANDGVEIVEGNLDDAASLENALAGAWGLHSVQNTWEAGVVREEEQGKRLATLARTAGIQHIVFSSVGSAHRETGIPHFENKSRIEETIRSLQFPSHVIIRPVFFMENLLTPWFLQGDSLVTALDPDTALQMIAVEDIGRYVARAFIDAEKLNGRAIDIAGDERTMPQTAGILARVMGRNITYKRIAIDDIRKNSEDFALMLEWFDRCGYNADVPALEREFGFRPLRLDEWAARQPRN